MSTQPTEANYIKHEFKIVDRKPLTLRCVYCEHGFEPRYVASSEWHEGKLEYKVYHQLGSRWAEKIKAENLILFDSASEAESHGFKPDRYVRRNQ